MSHVDDVRYAIFQQNYAPKRHAPTEDKESESKLYATLLCSPDQQNQANQLCSCNVEKCRII
jgi:hypothetical protein